MVNKKKQFSAGWLVIILVVLLSAVLAVLAFLLSAKVVALKNTEKNILILNAKENNFENLQQSVASLSEDQKMITDYFVTNETLPSFIEQLEGLASSAKVALNISNVTLTTVANPIIHLNFTVVGSFPRLFQFISLVDALPYLLDLTQASLIREGKKDGDWTGVFNLDLIYE